MMMAKHMHGIRRRQNRNSMLTGCLKSQRNCRDALCQKRSQSFSHSDWSFDVLSRLCFDGRAGSGVDTAIMLAADVTPLHRCFATTSQRAA